MVLIGVKIVLMVYDIRQNPQKSEADFIYLNYQSWVQLTSHNGGLLVTAHLERNPASTTSLHLHHLHNHSDILTAYDTTIKLYLPTAQLE